MSSSWLRRLERLLDKPTFDRTEPWCNIAVKFILDTFGDRVSVDSKRLSEINFGMNEDIVQDTETNISNLPAGQPQEFILAANLIDTISTTDNSFTGDVFIQGHRIDGGDLIAVDQIVTLNGQNKVAIPIPLLIVDTAEDADEDLFSSLSDLVIIYEDTAISGGAPTDGSKVHLQFEALHRRSLKASATFGAKEYGLITQFFADINKKTAATADILIRIRQLGAGPGRRPGGFKTRIIRSVSSTATNATHFEMRPYVIVPKNSIVTMNVIASKSQVSLSAGFNVITAGVIT